MPKAAAKVTQKRLSVQEGSASKRHHTQTDRREEDAKIERIIDTRFEHVPRLRLETNKIDGLGIREILCNHLPLKVNGRVPSTIFRMLDQKSEECTNPIFTVQASDTTEAVRSQLVDLLHIATNQDNAKREVEPLMVYSNSAPPLHGKDPMTQ